MRKKQKTQNQLKSLVVPSQGEAMTKEQAQNVEGGNDTAKVEKMLADWKSSPNWKLTEETNNIRQWNADFTALETGAEQLWSGPDGEWLMVRRRLDGSLLSAVRGMGERSGLGVTFRYWAGAGIDTRLAD
ncbi:MAG: hypothetical protein FWB72_02220 [Firmicutes bacterium]|nr:hypothetical protein [Bacillota bacterium]